MARIPSFLRGRKGGGDYKNTPDTIRSEDTVEVILGVGEGDNFGLAEGAKSFLMGGTALVNSNNEANFGDFQLVEYTGQSNPPAIVPYLGGFGSPKNANASSLAQNVPVIRTGELTQIDYIDLRFLIGQLVRSNDKGTYVADLQIRVEYRKSQPAGSPWVPAWSQNIAPPGYDENTGQSGVNVYSYGTDAQDYKARLVTFEGDDVYLRNDPSPGAPTGDFPNIWVDPSTGRPSTYVGGVWTPVGTDAGDSWTYGTTKFYKNPQTPPPNPNVGDVWTPPNGSAPLKFNGSSWVLSLIGAAINSKYAQPLLGNSNGILNIQQKITSPVVREVRVPVPRADVPYDLRITKITADSDSEGKYISEVGWESFEEIIAEGRSFPNTHILHLIGTASDQFTQLPELLGDVKGRVIDVPSNYDPVTRTYAGVWDGLFKKAWTDNGAWATRDFIKNSRYGLSALYPLEVREANFYNWAVWCDQVVPDNIGGTRARWTYNDDLSEPRQAKAQAEYMAGSCGGKLIDDGSGTYDVLVDRDEPMTMIFGPENIANDGEIIYSFSDEQTRANWIKVGFINPEKDWSADYRVVKDDDHIAEYGRIPLEFVATGKTNLSEALAAARLRLITGTTEYTAATWRTNRVGKFLFPFKVVGLCDPDMGWGISGRASAVTGPRQIRLRDPIYLEAGLTHKFTFNLPTSPITTATVTATAGQSGSLTVINFTTDLPALPEFPQFSVSTYNGTTPIATPKAFKILTITPADGDSEIVEITALELNRNKWAYVDGTGELLPAEEYTNFDQPLVSPQNVKLSPYIATAGGITRRSLQIQWDRPANPFGRNTLIEYSSDGGEFTRIAESETEYYELKDLAVGTHAIRLTHVHVDGVHKSRPVVVVHEIGEVRNVPPVVNARLADEAQSNIYESISPMFRWDHGDEDPNFRTYRVRVRHPVNNDVVRTVDVPLREFIYEFDKNTADFFGTPSRAFKVSVTKVDDYGNESIPSLLSVSNPSPQAPVVTVEGTTGGVNVKLSPSDERDIAGAIVQVDTEQTPLEKVLDVDQGSVFIPLTDFDVRLIRAAYYDRFSKTGLNWSQSQEVSKQATPMEDVQGLLGKLASVDEIAAQTQTTVAELQDVYGSTVSAAESAVAAAQAKTEAIQAKADAIIAQGQAQSASAEAILARADTVAAKNEAVSAAGASASSAAQAGGFKTDAETAAAASLQQKIEASAAREGAQSAANTPLATSPALSPDAFLINSFETLNGTPNLRQVFADNPGKIYPINSTVEINSFGSAVHVNTAKAMARLEGHRVRYSATVQRKLEGGTEEQNKVTLFAWFWNANGEALGGWEFYSVNPGTSSGAVTLTGDHLPPAGTAWTRTLLRVISYVGATAVLSLDTQDIESEKTATAAATASVASAASAAASENAAGQSAVASQQDRIAAQTARSQAEGFRDQSSASATTAAGAAATATEQAGLSASARDAAQGHASSALTSRNQASGFATDAETAAAVSTTQKLEAIAAKDEAVAKAAASAQSASNASASETQAGLQAAASQTAKIAAEAARGQAETYRNETATARDTAQGAAATATTQAGISASSATAAQAAANTPLATSPALSPDAFSVNDFSSLNGVQNLRQVYADNPGKVYPVNSTVEVNNFGTAVHLNTAKAVARPEGHTFRYSARIKRMAEGGDTSQNHVSIFAWYWDASGAQIGGAELLSTNPGTAEGTRLLTVDHLPPAGTAWTRTLLRVISYVGVTAVLSVDTQDIESEKTATAAATASVASASTASTKADEAGASASAASAAKIASELARDNASGSASASATSAGQSLTYRNQAGEFASASSGSATTAATKAGEAATSASQASTSAGNANTASISAGVSATAAGRAAASTLPSTFEEETRFFGTVTGPGLTIGDINQIVTYPTVAGIGKVLSRDGFVEYGTKSVIALKPGRKHRVKARGRVVQNGPNDTHQWVIGFQIYDANGAVLNQLWTEFSNIKRQADGWYDFGYTEPTTEDLQAHAPGATYIRPYLLQGWGASAYPGSTSEVSFLRYEDITESSAAASSAAAALTQAANATAAASSASISANLAASVGAQSSVINNGRFINWPSGQARPTSWEDWANCNQDPNIQSGYGWNGRRFVRMNYQPSMGDQGMRQDIDGFRGTTEPYNLDIEVAIPNGGPTGSGFYGTTVLLQCQDANGNYLGDAAALKLWLEEDINGNIPGGGLGDGRIYRFNKRVNLVPGTRLVRLYLMSRWTVVGPPGANEAKSLDWYSVSLTPMSGAESSVAGLSAQLQVTAATTADLATRMATAKFEVVAAAGSDPAQLLIRADNSGSLASLVAQAIGFSNVIGGSVVEVMKLIGGSVYIVGPLYLGPNKEIELNPLSSNPHISIKVGGGRMAFGKLPNDNLIYWFGPSQTVAAMRKNNATEWRDTLGNAYFGGSLAAGQLIARDRTSSLSVSASVDTGRYGSNGGTITVTASLSGGWGKTYYSASNLAAASESGTIVVSLDRAINGGAFSNGVATMSRAYTWSRETQDFEPGQGYRIVENGSYGGAITYTDPQQVAQDRQYRARITNFSPITLAGPPTIQDLSVISVE